MRTLLRTTRAANRIAFGRVARFAIRPAARSSVKPLDVAPPNGGTTIRIGRGRRTPTCFGLVSHPAWSRAPSDLESFRSSTALLPAQIVPRQPSSTTTATTVARLTCSQFAAAATRSAARRNGRALSNSTSRCSRLRPSAGRPLNVFPVARQSSPARDRAASATPALAAHLFTSVHGSNNRAHGFRPVDVTVPGLFSSLMSMSPFSWLTPLNKTQHACEAL